jgi:hypothetical protein
MPSKKSKNRKVVWTKLQLPEPPKMLTLVEPPRGGGHYYWTYRPYQSASDFYEEGLNML